MGTSTGTILLVDDDPAILLSVGDQLHFHGYEVVKAASAEQALEQLRHQPEPDLIILDISMPGIGGLGFLKQITDESGAPRHPILVFTARGELNGFFSDLGVNGFLPKVADPEDLLQEVDRIVGEYRRTVPHHADAVVRHRVVLAEDDMDVRNELTRDLERHGHEVRSVASGLSTIEAVCANRPSVVVVKFILPHMNGPTVAQVLGGMPSTRGIPVILYDDSGIHSSMTTFPNVRHFVPAADSASLLKVLAQVGTA